MTHPELKDAIKAVAVTTVMLFSALAVNAQSPHDSPVGRWRTISDITGKEDGAVEIVNQGGELLGRLIAGRNPATFDTEVCDKCPRERHNKPKKGLLLISGVRRDGDVWGGGEILDPDSGKIYRVKLRLAEGGKKLVVRGYIGFSLIGRTQTWIRME